MVHVFGCRRRIHVKMAAVFGKMAAVFERTPISKVGAADYQTWFSNSESLASMSETQCFTLKYVAFSGPALGPKSIK